MGMMKVDFDTVLRDLKGTAIKDGDGEFTLGAASATALLSPYPDEQNLDPKDKVRRYKLATKIADGGEVDLSIEEIADLKKLIGKAFPPLVVGRAYEILDPEPKVKAVA
jgi:hypothetical protein